MNEQTTTGARVPYADDSATGLPMYRNGEAVRAAIPTANGRYVILVERTCFEFVTAVTDSGRDGWDTGHYFPFGIPGRPVSDSKRRAAYGRALADLLGRASGYLDDSGREAFRADLRGYVGGLFAFDPCERCADRDRADFERDTFGPVAFAGTVRGGVVTVEQVADNPAAREAARIFADTFGGSPAAARCYLDGCDCGAVHGGPTAAVACGSRRHVNAGGWVCEAGHQHYADGQAYPPACGSDPRGGYACALGHFHVPAGYTDADARDADYRLDECGGAA